MEIVFKEDDINELIKRKLAGMGYSIISITNKRDVGYVVKVQSVTDKLSDIMNTRKKRYIR